jgi:hypothetical protein
MPIAKDTLFEISDFNVPKIISGADAWVSVILNLLFLENGTYSEAPELGLDLKSRTYMESTELVNFIDSELRAQVNSYMPEIPLSQVLVAAKPMENGDTVLYITLSFKVGDNEVSKSAFVSLTDEIVDEVVSHF